MKPKGKLTRRVKGEFSILAIMLLISLVLSQLPNVNADLGPSTVSTTTGPQAASPAFQRKMFYADGLWWYWFYNNGEMEYATSADGSTWSTPTTVFAVSAGIHFSIYFDGTNVYYAAMVTSPSTTLYFNEGTPSTLGTIAWINTSPLVVYPLTSTQTGGTITITADTNGYPYIGYGYKDSSTGLSYADVIKSSTNTGVWTTAGTPIQLDSQAATYVAFDPTLVTLSNSEIYALYFDTANNFLYGELYNGVSWGTEETIATNLIQTTSGPNFPTQSVVADTSGNVYVLYVDNSEPANIIFRERTYSNSLWSGPVVVQSGVTEGSGYSTDPSLTIDTSTGNLYAFWQNSPTSGHIYFSRYVSGAWTSATDWITEPLTDSEVIEPNSVDSIYALTSTGYSGVAWVTGGLPGVECKPTPCNARFAGLPAIPATISLSPSSGPVGTSVTVSGSNFAGGDTSCTISSSPTGLISSGSTCGVSSGVVSGSFTVASGATGTYTVTVTGSTHDSASAAFTVTSTMPSLTVTLTSPANGAKVTKGSTVTLKVTVKSSGKAVSGATVTITVNGATACTSKSTSSGSASCKFKVSTSTGVTYSWFATATKTGYSPGTSPTFTFHT